MKKNLYRITVLSEYLVLADTEEDAREIYTESGGDLEDEYVESVCFVSEYED